jgi:myo-inositol-1-phosphate synthase
MEGQCQNARQVIVGVLGLGEVASDMVLIILDLTQNIEQKDTHVPFQVLVI